MPMCRCDFPLTIDLIEREGDAFALPARCQRHTLRCARREILHKFL